MSKKSAVKKTARKTSTSIKKKAAPIAKVKKIKAKPIVKPASAKVIARSAASKPMAVAKKPEATPVKKASAGTTEFKVGHYVVYPTHGVGRIVAEETQQVGGVDLRVFVIAFEKDKMTLRVPVHRAAAAGLRNISSKDEIAKAFTTLKGRARISRGMWSRRAQEYEAKINSGNLISVAEVVRDLHKNVDHAERSYSERMIYESALGRLVGELAAAHSMDMQAATEKLLHVLNKAKAA